MDASKVHTLCVQGIQYDLTNEQLLQHFAVFYPSCTSARVMTSKTGESRGFGFVTFLVREEAEHAIATMNNRPLNKRDVRVNWAHAKQTAVPQQQAAEAVSPDARKVFIGNVHPSVDKLLLHRAFSAYGTVIHVGRPPMKSFAFVEFATHQEAQRAITEAEGLALPGYVGYPLRLAWGKEKQADAAAATPPVPLYQQPYLHHGRGVAQYEIGPQAGPQIGPQLPPPPPEEDYVGVATGAVSG